MLLTRPFFVFGFVFSFSFSFPDHLNVTTFLGARIRSFPVAGFLPFRFFLFFTQNLPKPEINTSSPDSRDCWISSSSISMVSIDYLFHQLGQRRKTNPVNAFDTTSFAKNPH
jgi:hypothetical protein